MKKMLINLFYTVMASLLIACCVVATAETIEVETYTVGCEVYYLEECRVGVRNDEFAHTFKTDEIQSTKYRLDEVVEVEVVVKEKMGTQWYEYNLLTIKE